MESILVTVAKCLEDGQTVYLLYVEALDQFFSIEENCLYDRQDIDFTNETEISYKKE